MDQAEWIGIGIAEGWCSPIYCDTHDGTTLTEAEAQEFEDGYDPCVPAIRLYEENDMSDLPENESVEAEGAPDQGQDPGQSQAQGTGDPSREPGTETRPTDPNTGQPIDPNTGQPVNPDEDDDGTGSPRTTPRRA